MARVDASQVTKFAHRLDTASRLIEEEGEDFQREWGGRLADEMATSAPVDTGALRDSIAQVEPGGIRIGVDYWPFVERGTARTAPQPFIGPSINRIRQPAAEDAGDRAVRLIRRSR